jgi:hypothetical protein
MPFASTSIASSTRTSFAGRIGAPVPVATSRSHRGTAVPLAQEPNRITRASGAILARASRATSRASAITCSGTSTKAAFDRGRSMASKLSVR